MSLQHSPASVGRVTLRRLDASIVASTLLLSATWAAAADDSRPVDRANGRTDEPETANAALEHPLATPLRLARESMALFEDIDDYEASFSKRELVNGQMIVHRMHIKHRLDPFSVYLRFFEPHEGREVIFAEGKYEGKLLAHDAGLAGLAGTFALLPNSPLAMSESRHPITHIGMKNLLIGVIKQWESEKKYGEIDVRYYNNANLHDRRCLVIEATHPRPRKQFEFHRTRLFLDKATRLPVRMEQYAFPPQPGAPPPLAEEYTYTDIKLNVGLTDPDFDPRNPKYSY